MFALRSNDRSTIALLDGLAVFWVVLWLVVAVLTASEIWALSEVSDSAEVSAVAVDRAGAGLQQLGELPLVGEESGQLGDDVRAAASDIDASAGRIRTAVHRLSVLLGTTIFLIPTAPIWALYLPARQRRRRMVSALAARLGATGGDDPALKAYLAHQAMTHLPYERLTAISPNPVADLVAGRHDDLAAAELQRLGLRPLPAQ